MHSRCWRCCVGGADTPPPPPSRPAHLDCPQPVSKPQPQLLAATLASPADAPVLRPRPLRQLVLLHPRLSLRKLWHFSYIAFYLLSSLLFGSGSKCHSVEHRIPEEEEEGKQNKNRKTRKKERAEEKTKKVNGKMVKKRLNSKARIIRKMMQIYNKQKGTR